jgi:hypothetical protein
VPALQVARSCARSIAVDSHQGPWKPGPELDLAWHRLLTLACRRVLGVSTGNKNAVGKQDHHKEHQGDHDNLDDCCPSRSHSRHARGARGARGTEGAARLAGTLRFVSCLQIRRPGMITIRYQRPGGLLDHENGDLRTLRAFPIGGPILRQAVLGITLHPTIFAGEWPGIAVAVVAHTALARWISAIVQDRVRRGRDRRTGGAGRLRTRLPSRERRAEKGDEVPRWASGHEDGAGDAKPVVLREDRGAPRGRLRRLKVRRITLLIAVTAAERPARAVADDRSLADRVSAMILGHVITPGGALLEAGSQGFPGGRPRARRDALLDARTWLLTCEAPAAEPDGSASAAAGRSCPHRPHPVVSANVRTRSSRGSAPKTNSCKLTVPPM